MVPPAKLLRRDTGYGSATNNNLDVDYVIVYRYSDIADEDNAHANFAALIEALQKAGLDTEVRNGTDSSIFVFVRANETRLLREVYRSRVKDWLFGVRTSAPEKNEQSITTLNQAERLRNVYHIITRPSSNEGAGITAGKGEWTAVESIFPLHDRNFNKTWLKNWSKNYTLSMDELTVIKDQLGPKVAYYFAFLQFYFMFLMFPAVFGIFCWLFLGHFSPVYAIGNCLWAVVFVECWKRKEVDLGVSWSVHGVSAVKSKNPKFLPESLGEDPITGELVYTFPTTKRLLRQSLQIPFGVVASVVLGALIALCFAIEIFIEEVYDGPMKNILVYLPMGILTLFMPLLHGPLSTVAGWLTDYENYETNNAHETALVQKMFVLDFITSFLPIFLTAFVYVPFGNTIVPRLDILPWIVKISGCKEECKIKSTEFSIDPERLKYQIIYFAISGQLMNFVNEMVIPFLKRFGNQRVKKFQNGHYSRLSWDVSQRTKPQAGFEDIQEEASFLARVRNEAELDDYDVNTDFREMCEQFGYLSLFSVVWPLTGIAFFLGDWIELRSDAFKICYEMKRPIPWRVDSIGHWVEHLSFMAWLASLSSSALVYLFSAESLGLVGTLFDVKIGAILTIFFSEHLYLIARLLVRFTLAAVESPGLKAQRAERYRLRKSLLEENFHDLHETPVVVKMENTETSRFDIDEDISTLESRFWSRQKTIAEQIDFGSRLISKSAQQMGTDKPH